MRRVLVLALFSIAVAGIATAQDARHPQFGTWGVDLSSLDKSIKPGDDFYSYTSGNWVKNATIAPDRINAGVFQDLQILSEDRLKDIFVELERRPEAQLSPEERKLRDLYHAIVDTDSIEQRGLGPVRKDLDRLQNISDRESVARALGSITLAIDSPFNIGIDIDAKDSNTYLVDIPSSGLGMPGREYYLSSEKTLVAVRNAYRNYVAKMLQLAGMIRTEQRAEDVLTLETRIAEAHWNYEDLIDPNKTYNPMPISMLKSLAPEFPWDAFFDEAEVPQRTASGRERIVVAVENTAFPKLAKIFAETPIAIWRDYLTLHYLHAIALLLPKRFSDADFAFYGNVITSRKQEPDRRILGVQLTDGLMGEALGKIYVTKYFLPEAKAKAQTLVGNILKAYEGSIQSLTWMSPETKARALDKLAHFAAKIGYPDTWREYSGYQVSATDPVGNFQRGALFEWRRRISRVDQPVDHNEWSTTPPTTNAYYQASLNDIVFPAALLQPPLFDPSADDAVNYGAIGAVIGHEISHGFDERGSQYDGLGRLVNWWTPVDRTNFEARAKALGAQFDKYEGLPGLFVSGKNTIDEDIADLTGLEIALKAYHLSLNGKPAPVIDGYTGDQRFFLSFGQIWRAKYRDDNLRIQVMGNVHAPGQFRVIGTTRNIDAWYDAFGIKPGDKYYLPPEQRITLW